MIGVCQLCKEAKPLQLSHIIPKFVFGWLKDSSISALRSTQAPNKRVQDGSKINFLCTDCELRFSQWEKMFSEKIFMPLHKSEGRNLPITYEDWALKFAVSVSWRVLTFLACKNDLSVFSDSQRSAVDRALQVWNQFLQDNSDNPDRFEQHLYPLGLISSHTTTGLSPFINRYILRAVDMDLIRTSSNVLVYTKMCRLMLIGVVQLQSTKYWKGAKLRLRRGQFGSKEYQLPANFLAYLNSRANYVASSLAKLSPNQLQKVGQVFEKNPDEVADSEVFRAINQDFSLFGDIAFDITNSYGTKEN